MALLEASRIVVEERLPVVQEDARRASGVQESPVASVEGKHTEAERHS